MSDAQHTPGPWVAEIDTERYHGADISIRATNQKSGNPIWIARAYNSGVLAPSDPEREANAALIASASTLAADNQRLIVELAAKVSWDKYDRLAADNQRLREAAEVLLAEFERAQQDTVWLCSSSKSVENLRAALAGGDA